MSDVFSARFVPDATEIAVSREVAPGVVLHVDAQGDIVGIEVRHVRDRASGAYADARVRERQAAWDRLLASMERGVASGEEAVGWKFDRDWAHER